jgi:hypothetical protein
MSEKILARWESKSGKHWVDLIQYESGGFGYSAPGQSGTLARGEDVEAISEIQRRVDLGYFQPDANKTPMKRVA